MSPVSYLHSYFPRKHGYVTPHQAALAAPPGWTLIVTAQAGFRASTDDRIIVHKCLYGLVNVHYQTVRWQKPSSLHYRPSPPPTNTRLAAPFVRWHKLPYFTLSIPHEKRWSLTIPNCTAARLAWCLAHDGCLPTKVQVVKLFVVYVKKAVCKVVESFNT